MNNTIHGSYRRDYSDFAPNPPHTPLAAKVTAVALCAIGAFASLAILPPIPGLLAAGFFVTLAIFICNDDAGDPPGRANIVFDTRINYPSNRYETNNQPNQYPLRNNNRYGVHDTTPARIELRHDQETLGHLQRVSSGSGSHVTPRTGDNGWHFGSTDNSQRSATILFNQIPSTQKANHNPPIGSSAFAPPIQRRTKKEDDQNLQSNTHVTPREGNNGWNFGSTERRQGSSSRFSTEGLSTERQHNNTPTDSSASAPPIQQRKKEDPDQNPRSNTHVTPREGNNGWNFGS